MKTAPSTAEISAALTEAEKKTAHSYSSVFSKKSKEHEGGWPLLQEIFGMNERLNDPGQPLGPRMTAGGGRRTFLPEDLTEGQIEWLRALEDDIDDAEFCARLADVLWLRAKDGKAATRAVSYYLDAGLEVEDLDHWTESIGRYSRAYRLATQLGRKSQLRVDVLDFLLMRLRIVKGDDPRWWSLKIMGLLYESRHGEQTELIGYARTAANRAERDNEFRRQRDYLGIVAKFYNRDQNLKVAEEEVRVEIAKSFRREAEVAEESGAGMNSHHLWEAAIKSFRERPSLKGQVPELQVYLATAGREMLEHMSEHSHSTDISDIVKSLGKVFSGASSDAAFYNLTTFALSDPDDLRREAEETKTGLLSSMFVHKIFDYEGRTVAIVPGALSPDDTGYEKRISSDVQKNAGFRRNLSVKAQIETALRIITSEHTIDEDFLVAKLADSAFIPEGRLEHYAEGLAFGFSWKFAHAALFLVPEFEAGLRNIAGQLGLTPRNLNASGVEDVWGLDRLLSEEAIVSKLGRSLTFELRSLLIEDFGPKFRHNLSHGLIPPAALEGTDALYAWWLFLRLCVFSTSGFHAFRAEGKSRGSANSWH